MSTQMYLLGGLVEGRVPSARDLRQQREARESRRRRNVVRRARTRRR